MPKMVEPRKDGVIELRRNVDDISLGEGRILSSSYIGG